MTKITRPYPRPRYRTVALGGLLALLSLPGCVQLDVGVNVGNPPLPPDSGDPDSPIKPGHPDGRDCAHDLPGYIVTQGPFRALFNALDGTKSARDFYGYAGAGPHTGLEAFDESTLFVYHDVTQNKFSLFILHDKADPGHGGSMTLGLCGLERLAEVTQNDDPHEGVQTISAGATVARWGWNPVSDGTALTFKDRNLCVTLLPAVVVGITRWSIVTGTLAYPVRFSLPNLDVPFSICAAGNSHSSHHLSDPTEISAAPEALQGTEPSSP